MAQIRFNGVDALDASLAQLAAISDAERYAILDAGAAVVLDAQRRELDQKGLVASGQLRDSLKSQHKTGSEGVSVLVSPTGKRKTAYTGKRKGKGGRYQGTNTEVGYILEYGSPRVAARHWMETANETADPDVHAAEAAAWDEHVKKSGL